MLIRLSLMVFIGLIAINAYAITDEEVFTDALSYTVKVRTRVEHAFLGEYKGSFNGAGFLVDAERAWIMTNAHVASLSPSYVSVNFYKGGDYQAVKKLYVDPYLDLAILEIPPGKMPENAKPAVLECEKKPGVGHPVGAFGHPWNLSFTGTRGIISGITSKVGIRGGDLLQTDAPINRGNSGGPLISMETAKVVGINSATVNSSENQNTNFAVQMKDACHMLRLLQEGKDPSPPALPLLFLLDLYDRHELVVATTHLDKDLIDLQTGDIIREVIGVPGRIHNEGQWIDALRGRLGGFKLKVDRKGEEMILSGKLRPAKRITELRGIFFSGIMLAPLNVRDWPELGLPRLIVNDVETGSIGQNEGIDKLDFLVSVDKRTFAGIDALYEYLSGIQEKQGNAVIKVKRSSDFSDRIYDYIERPLAVEELKYIGELPSKR
ncbi:MAG: trypsin-like serine protease [Gammaproteobacteria bacterium]|nr:trypsin-like serine protease [Gammaproteobacteria bacterium]